MNSQIEALPPVNNIADIISGHHADLNQTDKPTFAMKPSDMSIDHLHENGLKGTQPAVDLILARTYSPSAATQEARTVPSR